jgi:hypothetical protein
MPRNSVHPGCSRQRGGDAKATYDDFADIDPGAIFDPIDKALRMK